MKLYRIKALLFTHFYFSLNSLDRIFDVLFWPVLDIFIWGFMTHFISGISEFNILNVILGGIVLWVFIWRSSQDLVVYLLENYWSRSVYHLFSSPVKGSELIVSLCILGFIRSIIAFVILSTLSFLMYGFNILAFNPYHLVMFIGILLIFAWGLGLLVSSFIFTWGTRIQVLAWSTIWVIQPFSCVFYPLSALPNWAAKIAIILPTTHLFEQMRASMNGLPINYGSILYAFIFSSFFLVACSFLVSYTILRSKRSGAFAKPE
jgi:ABC-2 type transport system permease protein